MAVARGQVAQLLNIIEKYVDGDEVGRFFDDLANADAYRWNRSFRDTVDRLAACRVGRIAERAKQKKEKR